MKKILIALLLFTNVCFAQLPCSVANGTVSTSSRFMMCDGSTGSKYARLFQIIDTTKEYYIAQGRGSTPFLLYFNGTSWVRNDTSYIPRIGASNITGNLKSNQSYFELGLSSGNNNVQFSEGVYTKLTSSNGLNINGVLQSYSTGLGYSEIGVNNSTSGYSRVLAVNGSSTTTPDLSFKFDKGIAYYNGDYSAEMEASQNLIPSLKKVKQLISDSISGGGGSVNASNGLSLAGDTLKLGGTLNDTTIINTNNNTLTLAALSTDANKVVLSVTSDGYSILDVNNLGTSDLSLGFNAGINKTSGSENVIVGNRAVEDVSNIDYSNIQGYLAGNGCSSISESILNGYYSGSYVVSGSTLTGIRSGRLDTYGTYNSNLQGYYSGYSSKGFYGCNIFGYYGAANLGNAVPLRNSILIGNYTAYNDNVNTTTGGIIHIGNYTHTGGFNNTIAIGDSATNTKTNQVVFAPKYRHLRLRGVDYELPASQGATDTYLKNDGSGVLSWATVSGGSGTVTSVTSANTDISVANTTTTPVLTLNSGSGANQIVKRDGSGNLNATTVTTNANLTGVITSIGNATSITSQTGTGSTFAMSATPTFTTNITTPLIVGGTGTTSQLILRSTSGAGTTGSDIIFQNQTNGSNEPMRILSSGNVGIGTATPDVPLVVSNSYSASYVGIARFLAPLNNSSGNSSVMTLGVENTTNNAAQLRYYHNGSGSTSNRLDFGFSGNTIPAFSVLADGNLGIGTTTPQSKLDVEGNCAIGATYSGTTAAPTNGLIVEGKVGIGISTPTSKLQVVAGTLTDGVSGKVFTATMPTTITAANTAVDYTITGAGSSSFNTNAFKVLYAAGYTGVNRTSGANIVNNNAGIGSSLTSALYNIAITGTSNGTTTGTNVGFSGNAIGGDLSVGAIGVAITTKNSATNVGVVGLGVNAGTSPIQVGGYFGLNSTDPTFVSAALIADNSSQTSPIFLARDNGTTVFQITDGGTVIINSYTVATLPACAAGVYARATVTDALAPAYDVTVVGGGARVIEVICNGTNWVCH